MKQSSRSSSSSSSSPTAAAGTGTSSPSKRPQDHADLTLLLPDECLAIVLAFHGYSWGDNLFLVCKRFHETMNDLVAKVRYPPPVLPCTAHLEVDVRGPRSNKVRVRGVVVVVGRLWG